jgi:hypothetical protein
MTTLQTYVATHLRADGFSGLCSSDCGCSCKNDDELWPCDGPGFDCVPGYHHDCLECPRREEENCPMDGGGYADGYCVSAGKDWPLAEEEQ